MRILYLPNQYSQQRQRQKKAWVYPVLMAMEAEYYRQKGHDVDWGFAIGKYDKIISEPEGLPFLDLPAPDRVFTKAKDKKYQVYGNYKYHPATHMQVADGCWHGKCSFCIENGRPYKIRNHYEVLMEITKCQNLGFKEIFDDSATFPTGKWLEDFCTRMIAVYNKDVIRLGCNMRIGADVDFRLMKRAGFRMVLFGIESANQETLDRIQKGVKVEKIIPTIQQAKEAGLDPHIAVMFGYPWEKDTDADNTLRLVHYLLRKGYAKTAQASVYCVKDQESSKDARKYVKRIYEAAYSPEFWIHKFHDLRDYESIRYLWKQIKAGLKRG